MFPDRLRLPQNFNFSLIPIVGVDMLNPETRCKYAILNIPDLYEPIYLVFAKNGIAILLVKMSIKIISHTIPNAHRVSSNKGRTLIELTSDVR